LIPWSTHTPPQCRSYIIKLFSHQKNLLGGLIGLV